MGTISFEDFKKVDIRIGKIISAEKVEGSEKLLKLEVDFGEPNLPAGRQVIAGISQFYTPEDLIGKECPFVFNLAPKTLMGLESQGMILCASTPLSVSDMSDENGPVLLHPDKEIPAGSTVK